LASKCTLAKTLPSPPFPFSQLYFKWNGVVGNGVNIQSYTDPKCTVVASSPIYFGEFATVLSPPPPVPTPYSSWFDVPASETPEWLGTPQYAAAVAACSALFGPVGTATVNALYMFDGVTVSGGFRSDLWGCSAIDLTTTPFTQVRP
jgi:hypothetical protein